MSRLGARCWCACARRQKRVAMRVRARARVSCFNAAAAASTDAVGSSTRPVGLPCLGLLTKHQVANEWNELQTARLTSPALTLITVVRCLDCHFSVTMLSWSVVHASGPPPQHTRCVLLPTGSSSFIHRCPCLCCACCACRCLCCRAPAWRLLRSSTQAQTRCRPTPLLHRACCCDSASQPCGASS